MSLRIRKILVALDASERAPVVLDAAVDLAREYGSALTLFRGVGLPQTSELSSEVLAQTPDNLAGILEHHAEDDLETWAKGVPPEVAARTLVHVGVPWEAICRAAIEEDVDLIVIGSHGYKGLDRILGTTAAKVVNHADRSVLVVRQRP